MSNLIRPEALDERGCPLPWVPPVRPTEALLPGSDDEDLVLQGTPPPGDPGDPWLIELFDRLRALAGLPDFQLLVDPAPPPRRGLCTGRVWVLDGRPAWVWLSPCPNSDRAEVAATLAHELVHPLTGGRHDRAFKETLLGLAEAAWGPEFFQHAQATRPYGEVDRWVVTGIRAALAGRPPPAPKTSDEGDTARLVTRIRKLHALAASQPGQPEAVAASARANDLITLYGLGGYQVQLDAGIDEQMVDRWVLLRPRVVWQRHLAHAIARFFGVFSLSMARYGRMHFFGRHADVVATAYLVEVTLEAIERGAEAHLAAWKAERRRPRGASRRERVAFCGSATVAFSRKLAGMKDERAREAILEAEDFAGVEHQRRGLRWSSARRTTVTHNEAGVRLGESLEVLRGVASAKGPPKRLR